MFKKIKSVNTVRSVLYGKAPEKDDSLVGLMEKLAERRDYWANINGKETVLNWSFCVGPDTLVLTNKGLIYASDIDILSAEDTLLWNGISFVPKKDWIYSGNVSAKKITFTDSTSIIVSDNHPFRVNGEPVQAFDIKPKDTIDMNTVPVAQSSLAEAYVAGLFAYSDFNELAITQEFYDDISDILSFKSDVQKRKQLMRVTFIDSKTYDKYSEVRDSIMLNTQFFSSYLAGLFDAFYERNTKEIKHNHDIIFSFDGQLEFIVFMLSTLGINSKITVKRDSSRRFLSIKNTEIFKFAGIIPSRSRKLLNFLQTLTLKYSEQAPLNYKRVFSVEDIASDVYGPVEVEGGWYIANGIYNHNTPFTSKNHTPFEYAACIAGLTNRKTLSPAVEAARKLGFKFRVGTSSDTSAIAQVLTLGDRRLNKVIYEAYKSGVVQYFGGMSAGKDAFEGFERILKEQTGHDYELYGAEKNMNQVFPWDFVNVGMTKEHRKERYLQAKASTNSAFGCFTRCVVCGGCMVSQDSLPHISYVDLSKNIEIL